MFQTFIAGDNQIKFFEIDLRSFYNYHNVFTVNFMRRFLVRVYLSRLHCHL